MSDCAPEVGHRVRVTTTFTGVVDSVRSNGTFSLRLADGAVLHSSNRHDAQIILRVPEPEPEWQPGDVVAGADGRVYLCERAFGSGNWLDQEDEDWLTAKLPRPLTPLVRGGKPWAEALTSP